MAKWRVVSYDSEFTHYGVKGMKWGVRKDKPSSSKNQNGSSEKKSLLSKAKKSYKDFMSLSKEEKIKKGKDFLAENGLLVIVAAALPGVSLPMLLAGKAVIESYKFAKISSLLH